MFVPGEGHAERPAALLLLVLSLAALADLGDRGHLQVDRGDLDNEAADEAGVEEAVTDGERLGTLG